MGEQFEEEQKPALPSLPEFSRVDDERAVTELASELVESVRDMMRTVGLVERSAEANPEPLDGVFVENLMRRAMTRSDIAEGIARALDALAPLTSGESWQAWAKRAAEEPLEQPEE